MKQVDYELILTEIRTKYPNHTIDIVITNGPYPWEEPIKTLWVDGKNSGMSWRGSIAEDIYHGTGGKVDPYKEITFILNEEVKKFLDIL